MGMQGVPRVYSAEDLKPSEHCQVAVGLPDGRWVRARPLGFQALMLRERLKQAWRVFMGHADVLEWIEQ